MENPELKTVTDFNGIQVQYNPEYVIGITYGIWKNGENEGKGFAEIHMLSGWTITINTEQ